MLTQLADLVENGRRQEHGDGIVAPAPLLLQVELERKLGQLGAERVRELHRTGGRGGGITHLDVLRGADRSHEEDLWMQRLSVTNGVWNPDGGPQLTVWNCVFVLHNFPNEIQRNLTLRISRTGMMKFWSCFVVVLWLSFRLWIAFGDGKVDRGGSSGMNGCVQCIFVFFAVVILFRKCMKYSRNHSECFTSYKDRSRFAIISYRFLPYCMYLIHCT